MRLGVDDAIADIADHEWPIKWPFGILGLGTKAGLGYCDLVLREAVQFW